jgi:hypothetical protein
MGGIGSGRKPDPVKALVGFNQPKNTGVSDLLYLPNYSGLKDGVKKTDSGVVITSDNISTYAPTPDLTPYAKVDGTNQPFTGNLNINKTTPQLSLTDANSRALFLKKVETANELNLTNKTKKYEAGVSYNTGSSSTARGVAASNITLGTVWSIDMWIKFNGSANSFNEYGYATDAAGSTGGSALMYFNAANHVYYYSIGNAYKGDWYVSNFVTGGGWKHFVLTRNGLTITLYINGVSQGAKTLTTNTSEVIRQIGGGQSGGNIPGLIDEVVLWDKELSAAEVSARYNAGAGSYLNSFTNVLAAWHFDEGSGSSATDASGNGKTLTLGGSTWGEGLIPNPTVTYQDSQVIKSEDASATLTGTTAKHTFGADNLAETVLNGRYTNFNIGGVTKMALDISGNLTHAGTLLNTGATTITSDVSTTIPLTINLASSQSANALTLKNASATTIGLIDKDGYMGIGVPSITSNTALDIKKGNGAGLQILSGNASQYSLVRLGRTTSDLQLAVAGSSDQFAIGSLAGDLVFLMNGANYLFSQNNGSSYQAKINSNGLTLPTISSGSVIIAGTGGLLGADTDLTFSNGNTLNATNIGAHNITGNISFVGSSIGLPYGSMSIYNLGAGGQTVTVGSTDTWYEVTSGAVVGSVNLAAFQNNHEIVVTKAGKYKIDWSMTVEAAAANQEIEGTVFIDNTANTTMASHTETQAANKGYVLGGTGIIDLAASGAVSLGVLNHTATNDIIIDHLNLSLVMVGS